jgi:hypothetical protein
MNTRSALIIAAAIVLGFLSLRLIPEVRETGRYQVHDVQPGAGGNNPLVIVIDTQTGRCWNTNAYGSAGPATWREMGAP